MKRIVAKHLACDANLLAEAIERGSHEQVDYLVKGIEAQVARMRAILAKEAKERQEQKQ